MDTKQYGYTIGNYSYSMDSYMKGRQYYHGMQLGAGYKVNDHFSVFAGLRCIIGDATYSGYVRNIKFASINQTATAPYTTAVVNAVNQAAGDIEMTTDQKYNDEQKLIDHGTREFLAGAEWDITKLITVSAGWQNTHYSLSDSYMQDMSYNLSSNLLGVGVRLNVSEKVNVDLGYMHNFYEDRTVVTNNYLGTGATKSDLYERKNDVVAVGVNLNF